MFNNSIKRALFLISAAVFSTAVFLFLNVNVTYAALQAHWNFNEGQLQTVQESVNSKEGFLGDSFDNTINDPVWRSPGVHNSNSALEFSNYDRVRIPNNWPDYEPLHVNNNFSISSWIKINSSAGFNNELYIFNAYDRGDSFTSQGYQFGIVAGDDTSSNEDYKLEFGCGVEILEHVSSPEVIISTDEWHHVAVVFFDGNVQFYLDGNPLPEQTLSMFTSCGFMTQTYFTIGAGRAPLFGNFRADGFIDNLKIFSHALSASEVFNFAARGQVLNYSFESLVGNGYVQDSAGDNNAGWPYNASISFDDGVVGNSMDLIASGASSCVHADDQEELDFSNQFTLSGWFHFNGNIVNIENLIAKLGQSHWSYRIFTLNEHPQMPAFINSLHFAVSFDGTDTNSRQIFVDNALTGYLNQWVHIAATYDSFKSSENLKLYLNGIPLTPALPAASSQYMSIENTSSALGVGCYWDGVAGSHFDGKIDEVQLYNYALSDSEIATIAGITYASSEELVAEYSFDETTGQALDSSGFDNNSTLVRATRGADGVVDYAYSFDGTNACVDIPKSSSLVFSDAITVGGWFYFDGDIGTAHLISNLVEAGTFGEYYPWSFSLITVDDGLINLEDAILWQVQFNDRTMIQIIGDRYLAEYKNKWVHIIGTYDSSLPDDNLKLYLNGILVGTPRQSDKILNTDYGSITIGGDYNSDGYCNTSLNGIIDEVKIYNYALDHTQIERYYYDTNPYVVTCTDSDAFSPYIDGNNPLTGGEVELGSVAEGMNTYADNCVVENSISTLTEHYCSAGMIGISLGTEIYICDYGCAGSDACQPSPTTLLMSFNPDPPAVISGVATICVETNPELSDSDGINYSIDQIDVDPVYSKFNDNGVKQWCYDWDTATVDYLDGSYEIFADYGGDNYDYTYVSTNVTVDNFDDDDDDDTPDDDATLENWKIDVREPFGAIINPDTNEIFVSRDVTFKAYSNRSLRSLDFFFTPYISNELYRGEVDKIPGTSTDGYNWKLVNFNTNQLDNGTYRLCVEKGFDGTNYRDGDTCKDIIFKNPVVIIFAEQPPAVISGNQYFYAKTNNPVSDVIFEIKKIQDGAKEQTNALKSTEEDNSWYLSIDTTSLDDGMYEIRAIAYEQGNDIAYTEWYEVYIQNIELSSCHDKDNGKDYYVKGKTTYGLIDMKYEAVDECNGDKLAENYCATDDINGGMTSYVEEYSCSNGCSEGKCLLGEGENHIYFQFIPSGIITDTKYFFTKTVQSVDVNGGYKVIYIINGTSEITNTYSIVADGVLFSGEYSWYYNFEPTKVLSGSYQIKAKIVDMNDQTVAETPYYNFERLSSKNLSSKNLSSKNQRYHL